ARNRVERRGKQDCERAALRGGAGNGNSPLMSPDDAERRGKPQPSAIKLCGKERIENSRSSGFIHSAPGIPDFQSNVRSGSDIDVFRTYLLKERGYRDCALVVFPDSLDGVIDERDQYKPDLVGIRINSRQIRCEVKLNVDVLLKRGLERPHCFL